LPRQAFDTQPKVNTTKFATTFYAPTTNVEGAYRFTLVRPYIPIWLSFAFRSVSKKLLVLHVYFNDILIEHLSYMVQQKSITFWAPWPTFYAWVTLVKFRI